jgi:hypothetical protein
MKRILFGIVILSLLIYSCKKDKDAPDDSASLTIVNADQFAPVTAINFSTAKIDFSQAPTVIPFQGWLEFGLQTGSTSFNLVSSSDTTAVLLHSDLNLTLAGIYSLYVAGTSGHTDTVLMKDNIPYYASADSVAGTRFINLSPDSGPVSINLAGSANPEFSSLAYKKITLFKPYAATSNITNNGGYNYEVRDGSGNLLATFNWMPTVYKNYTLVISGMLSNSTVSVFAVNNF